MNEAHQIYFTFTSEVVDFGLPFSFKEIVIYLFIKVTAPFMRSHYIRIAVAFESLHGLL